MIFIYLHIKFW